MKTLLFAAVLAFNLPSIAVADDQQDPSPEKMTLICNHEDGRNFVAIFEDGQSIRVEKDREPTAYGTYTVSPQSLTFVEEAGQYRYTRSNQGRFFRGVASTLAKGDTCRLERANGVEFEYPFLKACRQSQDAITETAEVSMASIINLGDAFHCGSMIGFEDAQSMLKFVDERIAAGKSPVVEPTQFEGANYQVALSLQITGTWVFASGGAGSGEETAVDLPAVRAKTPAEIASLKRLLEERVHGQAKVTTIAAGDFMLRGGQALHAEFESVAALRNYVAEMVAANLSPAPIAIARETDVLAMAVLMSVNAN